MQAIMFVLDVQSTYQANVCQGTQRKASAKYWDAPHFREVRLFVTFPLTNNWCRETLKHIGMGCVLRCSLYVLSNYPVCV